MPTMTAQQRRDEARAEFDAFLASCPSRKLLDRISDKWVTLVLKSLVDGPKRYSEVSRQLAGVLGQLKTWAEQHMPEVDQARADYDARQ